MDSMSIATRILIVFESGLPFGRQATFGERLEAMRKAVESLGLEETAKGANLKEIVRAPVEVTQ